MKMTKKSLQKNTVDKKTIPKVSMAAGAAGVNCSCHTVSVQVPGNDKHVTRVLPGVGPHVVPIFWGHYYVINPDVPRLVTLLISDLVTGPYMNGLAQYGVGRGTMGQTTTIDMTDAAGNPIPDPINLSRGSIETQLGKWISGGLTGIRPLVDGQNVVFVIFLPTGSTTTEPAGEAGYHNHGQYNPASSNDDMFWAVVITNANYVDQSSATNFANSLSFVVSHELCETFTDRDEDGFIYFSCEIGDICESRDPTCQNCCTTFPYTQFNRTWQVEPYWSNWDNNCINGNQPVSIRKFLQAIGVDGSRGLRQLQSNVINVDYVASKM
jgi:hypothetical protein